MAQLRYERAIQQDWQPPAREAWADDALCRSVDPDLMYLEVKGRVNVEALAVCERCPVTEPCLEYALRTDQRYGVWGGTTPTERERARRRRQRTGGRRAKPEGEAS